MLDRRGRPLQPCHPSTARRLLRQGRAVVARQSPFVIRLKDRDLEDSNVPGVEIGIDPGSKTTGFAVFAAEEQVDRATGEVVVARRAIALAELVHRGLRIKLALQARAALRRGRRSRNLRYRAPRFDNRRGWVDPALGVWLPPSIRHRIDGIRSWVSRLRRWLPVRAIHIEDVRFDTQLLERPGIAGVQYQQGTLFGFEVREYLLEKWGRACAYCDVSGTPLNIDHVVSRSRGGSDRISNLALACIPCNQAKSNRPLEEFATPEAIARIRAQMRRPLRDAAAMNAVRQALARAIEHDTGLPVLRASGGRTKWNRTRCRVPKSHALDALCVGDVDAIPGWPATVRRWESTGRGSYQRTRTDRFGFPRGFFSRSKRHHGFQTGDLVIARVPSGKHRGTHRGRVAVRATGSFNIDCTDGRRRQGINAKHCTLIQRADGYRHSTIPAIDTRETSA